MKRVLTVIESLLAKENLDADDIRFMDEHRVPAQLRDRKNREAFVGYFINKDIKPLMTEDTIKKSHVGIS